MGVIVHRDLRFVHGFQQRGLRLGRGAVDFVGYYDVGEDWPGLEFEFLRRGIEHADADHVAGQQVRSKLNALERAAEGARQSLRKRGLADARNVFNQQMPAREQRGERELDDVFLALYDARDRVQKFGEARAGVSRGCLQFAWPSATKIGCRCFSKWPCRLRLQPRRPLLIFRGIQFSPGSAAQRGRLAQWLERSPHTGEVQGSSPWSPTTHPTVQFYHQSLDDAKSG